MNTCVTIDNLLWFVHLSHNGLFEYFKKSKDMVVSALGSSSTIGHWLTTLIHSYRIYNHIPIRITIIIYNFMHVTRTRSWPNHLFYHSLVRNIWFFVCKPTLASLHEPFLYKMHSYNIWIKKFLFSHLLHGHLIAPLIFLELDSA
jgi:hypothetical protein